MRTQKPLNNKESTAFNLSSKKLSNSKIDGGSDVNAVSEKDSIDLGGQVVEIQGSTHLMLAAQGGHLEVFKLLLSKGARLDATNSEGWTVPHYASVPPPDSFIRGKGAKPLNIVKSYAA